MTLELVKLKDEIRHRFINCGKQMVVSEIAGHWHDIYCLLHHGISGQSGL